MHNEVIVAALELIETIFSLTPYPILDFQPFFALESKCSSVYNSPFRLAKDERVAKKSFDFGGLNNEKEFLLDIEKRKSEDKNIKTDNDIELLMDGNFLFIFFNFLL